MECVTGPELALRAVIHLEGHPAFDHTANVLYLTRVGAGNRFHVVGPAPAWLKGSQSHRVAVEVDEREPALALGEFPYFIRVVETLPQEFCHAIVLTEISAATLSNRCRGDKRWIVKDASFEPAAMPGLRQVTRPGSGGERPTEARNASSHG